MSTDIQPYRVNGALEPYNPGQPVIGAGYDALQEEGNFGEAESQVRPPRLKYDGKLGDFTDPLSGEVSKSVRLVVLKELPRTRAKLNPDLDAADTVQCQSLDMVHPLDPAQATAIGAGPTCIDCPFAQYGVGPNGKKTKKPCGEQLNFVVALEDADPFPYLFRAKSTAIKPMRALMDTLVIMRRRSHAPGYTFVAELSSGPLTGEGSKKYFPLVAQVAKESPRIDASLRPAYAALWHMVHNVTIDVQMRQEDEDAPDADAAREPGDGSTDRPYSGEELDAEIERREAESAMPPDDNAANDAAWASLQASEPPHGDPVDQPRRRGRL